MTPFERFNPLLANAHIVVIVGADDRAIPRSRLRRGHVSYAPLGAPTRRAGNHVDGSQGPMPTPLMKCLAYAVAVTLFECFCLLSANRGQRQVRWHDDREPEPQCDHSHHFEGSLPTVAGARFPLGRLESSSGVLFNVHIVLRRST